MSKSVFEIDMIDTLKRSIKEISDIVSSSSYKEHFQSTVKIAEEVNANNSFSYENDNSIIEIHNHCSKSEMNLDKYPIQEIHIYRYNNGGQIIDVHNYNYINYNDPIVIESAGDIDVIFNSSNSREDKNDD